MSVLNERQEIFGFVDDGGYKKGVVKKFFGAFPVAFAGGDICGCKRDGVAEVVSEVMEVMVFAGTVVLGVKGGVKKNIVESMAAFVAMFWARKDFTCWVMESPWVDDGEVTEPLEAGGARGMIVGSWLCGVKDGVDGDVEIA